jgi:hypothetical protein
VPNPFTATAVEFYEDALARGARAAALGVSDSHNAGRTPGGATQSPVGVGSTAVYARELSERGIRCAVQAGHTYAKVGGPDGPDLRFTGRVPGVRRRAIFGDTVRGRRLELQATALGVGSRPALLMLVRDGRVIAAETARGPTFTIGTTVTRSGRYGVRLMRGQILEALGTPIWFERARRSRIATRGC